MKGIRESEQKRKQSKIIQFCVFLSHPAYLLLLFLYYFALSSFAEEQGKRDNTLLSMIVVVVVADWPDNLAIFGLDLLLCG